MNIVRKAMRSVVADKIAEDGMAHLCLSQREKVIVVDALSDLLIARMALRLSLWVNVALVAGIAYAVFR